MNNIYTSSLWRKPNNNNLGDRVLNWLLSEDSEVPDKYQNVSSKDDIYSQPPQDERGNVEPGDERPSAPEPARLD